VRLNFFYLTYLISAHNTFAFLTLLVTLLGY